MIKEKTITCISCKKKINYDLIKPDRCLYCGDIYYDKPATEHDLFLIQHQYLTNNRDPKYLGTMYPIISLYTKKLMLDKIKGKIFFQPAQVEEKCLDLVGKIYEYYLRSDSWKIGSSFAGCIKFVMRDVLYNHKRRNEDSRESLNLSIDEKGNEILDNIVGFGLISLADDRINIDEEFLKVSKEILNNIHVLIDMFSNICNQKLGSLTTYKILCGINHLLERRIDRFMDKYFDVVGRDTKKYVEFFYIKIYDYLINYKSIEDVSVYFEKNFSKFK